MALDRRIVELYDEYTHKPLDRRVFMNRLLAIAGTTMSRRILERLTDASFRQWTRWTVMSMGVFYLASGAWLLARG